MSLNNNFAQLQQEKVIEIEQLLRKYLPVQSGYQKIITEAMEYSLMAGGKRLRPMMMQEVFRLFGGTMKAIEPFMAAIEMIHTYSLVHDDLPAMDNDDYRRGRKTTHVVYGEDIGILAGDALLNYAFETAFHAFELCPQDSLKIGKALQVLGEKAGIHGMIGGQVIDVKETGKQIDREVLDTIYELKTSALIEASMMVGAILAGATDEELENTKKSLCGGFKSNYDSIYDIMGWYAAQNTRNTAFAPEEINERIAKLTREDIISCAKTFKPDTVFVIRGEEEEDCDE